MDSIQFENEILKYTLSLYNIHQIPRSSVQDIIDKTRIISEMHASHLTYKIIEEIGNDVNLNIIERIRIVMNENQNPFKKFSSEHLRFKEYKKKFGFVLPEYYRIGEDSEVIFEDSDVLQNMDFDDELCGGVNIPLSPALKKFLEMPGVFSEIEKYMEKLNKEKKIFLNFIQGSLWQTKYAYLDIRLLFPLFVFYDDYEARNALGSKAGEQACGGVYVSLPFLPPHLTSKLSNLFVSSIFYTKHRKLFGNHSVFWKSIEDLRSLCLKGLTLNINGVEKTIFFRVGLLVGDQLGLNCICGYSGGFSAEYYCRICKATISECQHMCFLDESKLRTIENYEEDVKTKSHGVLEECIFNGQLPDFHIIQNKSMDFMHDGPGKLLLIHLTKCYGIINFIYEEFKKVQCAIFFFQKGG